MTGNIYLARESKNILYSADRGVTWTQLVSTRREQVYSHGNTGRKRASPGAKANNKYCVYRYLNGVWVRSSSGITAQSVWQLVVDNGLIFAAGDNGIYRSADDGTTWTAEPGLPPFSPTYQAEIRPQINMMNGTMVVGVKWSGKEVIQSPIQ